MCIHSPLRSRLLHLPISSRFSMCSCAAWRTHRGRQGGNFYINLQTCVFNVNIFQLFFNKTDCKILSGRQPWKISFTKNQLLPMLFFENLNWALKFHREYQQWKKEPRIKPLGLASWFFSPFSITKGQPLCYLNIVYLLQSMFIELSAMQSLLFHQL